MKKYLLGLLAIVLAIGVSSFTANQTKSVRKGNTADLLFQFVAPNGTDFSQAAVENESNWVYEAVYDGDNNTCSGLPRYACEIVVSDTKTTGGSTPALDPGLIQITATLYQSGIYFVDQSANQDIESAFNKTSN